MGNKLKPCPFCGCKEIMIANCIELEDCEKFEGCDEEVYLTAVCNFNKGGCGASGGYRRTKEEAIEAWNRRVEE